MPHKFRYDGTALGPWVKACRDAYEDGTLPTERIQRLEAAGFTWRIRGWEPHFAALKKFVSLHGSAVPRRLIVDEGLKLGWWASTQRKAYASGMLPPDQVEMLDGIGFRWTLQSSWDDSFQLLESYYEEFSTSKVPYSHVTECGNKLGLWCENQRRAKRQGTIGEARVFKLETVGFQWDVWMNCWESFYSHFSEFQSAQGHCSIPRHLVWKGIELGKWAKVQRADKRKGSLGLELVRRLNLLKFEWDPPPEM
ncbi:hypothetical protein M885DRAFT_452412 [Pelagophyceae sp. CCMP2097]|nr:hypothetical protein M885DRAFT_452412 [Pelagophyceae sp. CCMP2097]